MCIAPQARRTVRRPWQKLFAAALVSLLAVVGVARAATHSGQPNPRPRIGNSITIESYDEHVRITVLAVQTPAKLAYRFATPAAGDRYVGVLLRIVNLSQQRYNDSPSNGARLITATRAAYAITLPGKEPNLDEMAAIPPGGQHTGWLTFEVPAQARLAEFLFVLDSGFAAARGLWLLH